MNTSEVINPDLAKERQNATVKLDEMKSFLGEMIYLNQENYRSAIKYSKFKFLKNCPFYFKLIIIKIMVRLKYLTIFNSRGCNGKNY